MNADQRRRLMSRFRSKDTKPEVLVRKALHRAGRRFRLHMNDLPGRPDIVLRKDQTVVMVHGCFWHQHEGCSVARLPKSNPDFWREKFARNQSRDVRVKDELEKLDWRVVIIWECEAKSPELVQLLVRLGLISADRAELA